MDLHRRKFVQMVAGGLAAATIARPTLSQARMPQYHAIAFDAFPIFDPRPVFQLVKYLYPEQGEKFSVLWRSRIFEYTWLRVSAHRYKDFWSCIDDALTFTANHLKLKLLESHRHQLMQAFLHLEPYPDVVASMEELKSRGIKLAFLSNMTDSMLHSNIKHGKLDRYIDQVISTELAKTFKPDPRAYRLGLEKLGMKKEHILFAAFASWDAVGARWFGYPTVWVNRLNFTPESLDVAVDHVGPDLAVVLDRCNTSRSG